MKIGLIYPQTELAGDPLAVRQIALTAEQLGYDYILSYDHVLGASHDREPKLWGPYTEHHPFHDPLVMFAHMAAITTRLEFASGVLILPQRQTALVARQAADVDLLSGGRFTLGVGTGWNYVEYDALGQDFATRGKPLNEQFVLLRRLWEEPLVSFAGAFDAADRVALNPRPPPPADSHPPWRICGCRPAPCRPLGRRLHFRGWRCRCIRSARTAPGTTRRGRPTERAIRTALQHAARQDTGASCAKSSAVGRCRWNARCGIHHGTGFHDRRTAS